MINQNKILPIFYAVIILMIILFISLGVFAGKPAAFTNQDVSTSQNEMSDMAKSGGI